MKFKFSLVSVTKGMKFKVPSFSKEMSSNSKEFYIRRNFIGNKGFPKAAHLNNTWNLI